ncbi:MAG: hypothetical protein AAB448_00360 [Patescibacteria group bacterium]
MGEKKGDGTLGDLGKKNDKNIGKKSEVREHTPKQQRVDLSKDGYNVDSWSEAFVEWAKKQKWYRPNLLYTGFDADDIGKNQAASWGAGTIFCAAESDFLAGERSNNPIDYAQEYTRSAIAVYDPAKMEEQSIRAYRMTDPSALIVVVKLKLE